MIPLMLDLSDKRVVIFGGGEVGARKAAFFSHEAKVLVISTSFVPEFDALNTLSVNLLNMDISLGPDEELSRLIEGAFIVVGATSDKKQNNRIGKICRDLGIHFNNADGKPGDIIVPSVISGKHYLIGISTMGNSPAVSRYIRMILETECAGLDDMIVLQEELRSVLKKTEPDQKKRVSILRDVLNDSEIWEMLEEDLELAIMKAEEKYV